MLFRIQTLYIVFASIVPIIWFFSNPSVSLLDPLRLPSFLFFLLVSFLLSIISVFFYKKRLNQIKLIKINILLNIFPLGMELCDAFFSYRGYETYNRIYSLITVVSIIVLLLLANWAINRDEQLVKSIDRLR